MNKKQRVEILDEIISKKCASILKNCIQTNLSDSDKKNAFKKINVIFTIVYGQMWTKNFGISPVFDEEFENEWVAQVSSYSYESIVAALDKIKSGKSGHDKYPPTLIEFRKVVEDINSSTKSHKCEYIGCKNNGRNRVYVSIDFLSKRFCDDHDALINRIDDVAMFFNTLESGDITKSYARYFIQFSSPPSNVEEVNKNLCKLFKAFAKTDKYNVDYTDVAELLFKIYCSREMINADKEKTIKH